MIISSCSSSQFMFTFLDFSLSHSLLEEIFLWCKIKFILAIRFLRDWLWVNSFSCDEFNKTLFLTKQKLRQFLRDNCANSNWIKKIHKVWHWFVLIVASALTFAGTPPPPLPLPWFEGRYGCVYNVSTWIICFFSVLKQEVCTRMKQEYFYFCV